jgi:hypothetical protein
MSISLDQPLDSQTPEAAAFLSGIQGNMQEWPPGNGVKFNMANFVKMPGGEYFFAPSLAFLNSLTTR